MKQRSVSTQFGDLTLTEEGGAITALDWTRIKRDDSSDLLEEAARQLLAYDAGDLEAFDLPLRVAGSAFQRDVCAAMSAIPLALPAPMARLRKSLASLRKPSGRPVAAIPFQ